MARPDAEALEKYRELIHRCQRDPVLFAQKILKKDPWEVQRKILYSVRDNPRTAVPSCHASGKSFTAMLASLWFLYAHKGARVVTTAPTGRQVHNILWAEIASAKRDAAIPLKGQVFKNDRLEIDPNWFAFGFSTDKPDSFQGLHADHILIIFDEASGIESPIWEQLEGNLASGKVVRFLAIGNPTDPTGLFFDECQDPRTTVLPISVYDTPNFTQFGIVEADIANHTWREKVGDGTFPYQSLADPDWAERLYHKYGKDSAQYHARCLGRFPQQGSDALVWLAWAQAATYRWENAAAPAAESVEKINIGVDVARFGDDETVITTLTKGYMLDQQVFANQDTTVTAGLVWKHAREMHETYPNAIVSIRIDEPGVGAGVVDTLRANVRRHELRYKGFPWLRIVPCNTGKSPRDSEAFQRRRDEWWWAVREWFESSDIAIINDPTLIHQLTTIRYSYTPRGQVAVEQKSDAKKRGLTSPDRADSLMLALAPVKVSAGAKVTNLDEARKRKERSKPAYLRAL